MIRRIELVNFMSHAKTVIEPAAGLTVLVGPNNCGKSAVVAALQILCRNDNSTFVLRHNERACSVTVETDDGHTITWGRTKTSPRYEIDGIPFDRLDRSAVPDALHAALRLPLVVAENNLEFDVHFGEQKSPIFLLDQPPSSAAQFFASSSDASTLIEMQRLHQQRTAEAKREHRELDSSIALLEQQLTTLAPTIDLEARLGEIESSQRALDGVAATIAALKDGIDELCAAEESLRRVKRYASAMDALTPPPAMGDRVSLETCVRSAEAARGEVAHAQAMSRALGSIEPLPDFQNEDGLRAEIATLGRQRRELDRHQQIRECVNAVKPMDPPRDTKPIAQAIAMIDRDVRLLVQSSRVVEETIASFAPLDREIAALIREHPNCPTCGAALDPSKLQTHFHRTADEDADA